MAPPKVTTKNDIKQMSVDTSAAVISMAQGLFAWAETGEKPSEHVVAQRMLRASAMPAFTSLGVRPDIPPSQSFTAIRHAPKSAAPPVPSGDKFDQLVDLLQNSTLSPDKQAAKGNAPIPPVINIKPEAEYEKSEVAQYYLALLGMASMAQLYAGIVDVQTREKRGHPDPYKISDAAESVQAFADQADEAYQAMLSPLARFFIFSGGATQKFSRSMTRAEFHTRFLGEIFKGFNLSDNAMKQLDTILNNFASAMGSVKIESESTNQQMSHTLKANTVPPINLSGDDEEPVWVYQPTTTIIYMKIDINAWRQAMSKWSEEESVEHFDFNMSYSITQCQLNVEKYLTNKPRFDQIFQLVSGTNLEAFGVKLGTDVTDKSLKPVA